MQKEKLVAKINAFFHSWLSQRVNVFSYTYFGYKDYNKNHVQHCMLFEFHKSSNSTNIMKNIYALYPGGETGYVCSSNDLASSKWLTVIFLISSVLEGQPLWIMIYWSRSSTRKLSKSSKYYVQLYKISLSIFFLPKYQVQHSIIYKNLLTRN